MKVLIPDGSGLVGSESCRLFVEKGWEVISIDNYMRGKLFGLEGSTKPVMEALAKSIMNWTLGMKNNPFS